MKHLLASIYGTALAFPLQAVSTTTLPPLLPANGATSISNATLGTKSILSSNSQRPNYPVTDPFNMRISASGIVQILEFYDYRNSIQSSVVIHLLNLATSSALRHPSGSPVATSEIQYWATDVQLILYPEEHMTWRMWRNALVGMKKFVALEGMSYGWSFVVMDKVPHDVLGWGVLTNVTDDKLRTAPVDPNKQ